jgi:chromate transporter
VPISDTTPPAISTTISPTISFSAMTRLWMQVAINSFGGPAGQIAVMHKLIVDQHKLVSEQRFLHALNYCMLLPGPEAQQLATYLGWLFYGTRGGLVAGGLFVLPGFLSILALSIVYVEFHNTLLVEGLFFGIKAAVLAVVIEAVQRIGKRVLKNRLLVGISGLAFIGIFFFKLPFPLIIGVAALLGLLGSRLAPQFFLLSPAHTTETVEETHRPPLLKTCMVAASWLVLWLGPVLALRLYLGADQVFVQIGKFFSSAAVVTFGGAYSVLAYIAQAAVEQYQWLTGPEMLDGLGMAETTPGPLIQVVQFVGFLAAYRNPGELAPLTAGVLGAILTTWVTFMPSFLWIFTGAPYIEWLRGNKALSGALTGITAAVVGVVLNLGVWLGLHILFRWVEEREGFLGMVVLVPDGSTLSWGALLITAGALLAIFRFHLGMIPTLLLSALVGLGWSWLT